MTGCRVARFTFGMTQTSTSMSRRHALQGAALGAAVGLSFGLGFGAANLFDEEPDLKVCMMLAQGGPYYSAAVDDPNHHCLRPETELPR